MTIQQQKDANGITLLLEGRLDTGTAPAAQQTFLECAAQDPHITLDFNNVSYVSSAGLRSLLILQKTVNRKRGFLHLTGVRPEIMEIFQMTGFASILSIS